MKLDLKNLSVTKESENEICIICGELGAFEGICDDCYLKEESKEITRLTKEKELEE